MKRQVLPPYAVVDQVASRQALVPDPAYGARQSAAYQQVRRAGQLVKSQVQQANHGTEQQNERATLVLRELTGVELHSDPRRWWQWWKEYVDQHPRIRYLAMERLARVSRVSLTRSPAALAKDTVVWSNTGKVPIQTLKRGDLILAQDPTTQRLVYKPVIGISRSVQPLHAVRLSSGDAIFCSSGCVFWRDLHGWWRAGDLDEQAQVRGLRDSHSVTNTRRLSEGEAFALEVADVSNFIVGEHGVLVHDKTRPQPVQLLNGPVPAT